MFESDTTIPVVEAVRDGELLIVPRCPFCSKPHYYLRCEGSYGRVVASHCRDNRRRDRADRRFALVPNVRARARELIEQLLRELMDYSAAEVRSSWRTQGGEGDASRWR